MSSVLRPRKHARHARPSRATPLLLAGGLTAVLAVTDAVALSSAASAGGSAAQFERLAQCESGGNWSTSTGNGYYGGLQFDLSTWRALGFGGYPHQASRSTQISAGQKLHSQRGWSPWPSCSRKLGLTGDGGNSGSGTAPTSKSTSADRRDSAATASRSRTATRDKAPAYSGRTMTTASGSTFRADVKTWQSQMRTRGWKLGVDGYFGPQSAAVATRFADQKDVSAPRGTVNAAVWSAAWTARVS